jgi:CRISPR-associated endoribonuclease Cas6
MRLKLYLNAPVSNILPFNYEYAISAWIYKMLAKADPTFATWLHNQGYHLEGNHRKFKLFTFSKIQLASYKVIPQKGFLLKSPQAELTLSFLIDKAMQDFVIGLFQSQSLSIHIRGGSIDFKIMNVEVLPEPTFKPVMPFRAMTPIFMSKREKGVQQPVYISPNDANYQTFFINNLIEKTKALGEEMPIALTDFRALTRSRSELLHIDDIKIKAFYFNFIIAAPVKLIRIGYFAGFGGKNSSLGLGFCEIKQDSS